MMFTVDSFVKMIRFLLFAVCLRKCLSSEIPVEAASRDSRCRNPLDQVFDRLDTGDNIVLTNGVKLVKVNQSSGENEVGRSATDSIFTQVKRFFTNYELQVKLSDFFSKKQDMIDTINKALVSLNEFQDGNENTFRGKGHVGGGGLSGGKKGGNAILMMATMMGGTMAALGFGALAMLVMKALTVSSMALLLSAVLGLRRLLRRPDDDAGFGRISYIPVHAEHRKRRGLSLYMPYRAYAKNK